MDFTAPSPSNTAPKQSAAVMIQKNMHEMASVLRVVSCRTFIVSVPRQAAASSAPTAPTAELSTRLVTPVRNSPVMVMKISSGISPALSSFTFSASG